MSENKERFEQIGVVGVDSGTVMIGDPCYSLHKGPGKMYKDFGTSWQDFCERKLRADRTVQLNYDKGHAGLAVVTSSGFGDGCYPVFARIEKVGPGDERIMAVLVDFSQHAVGIKMKSGKVEKDTRKIFDTIVGRPVKKPVPQEFFPGFFMILEKNIVTDKFLKRISFSSDAYGNILGRCTCGMKNFFNCEDQGMPPLDGFKMWIVEHLCRACGKYEPKDEEEVEAALKRVTFSVKKVTREVG